MKLYATLLLFLIFFLNSPIYATHDNGPDLAPTTVACNGFTYCTSQGNNVSDEWIESFELNTINNVSGANGGYADFTNFTTELIIGNSYDVTCTPGYADFTYNEVFRIWIDYNIDGDFDDPNELVFDPAATTTTVMGNFTVPLDAVGGETTMRVSMKFSSAPTACEASFTFGEVEDYCVSIGGGNGCYLPVFSITDVDDTSAALEWSTIDDAQNFNIRYREIGTTPWTEVNTTEQSLIIDVEPCAFYEVQIQTVCDTVSSNYSYSYEFLTLGCGNCIDQVYCTIASSNPTYGYIDNVTLNTMNSTTGDNNGYGDFTGPVTTSIEQGLTYDLSISHIFPNFQVSHYFVAWIDFNANGSFDDPFEKVLDSGEGVLDLTVSQNFPVPPTAVVGTTRMRVMISAFSTTLPGSCPDFMTGEYEDYCIEITEGTGCYLPLGIEALDIEDESATLLWDQGLDAESFTVRYREVGAFTWITIDDILDNTYLLGDLDPCTEYEFQLKTNCVGLSTAFSTSVEFITFGCGACFDYEYCPSNGSSTAFEYIETFSIGTEVNNSGDNVGYVDFEDQFGFIIRPDSTYELFMEPFYPFGNYNVNWKVWIDYNSDGDFEDTDELLFNSGLTTAPVMASITVPTNAAIGLTKMRVSMREFSEQVICDEFFYGEVEDYCITIEPTVLPCLLPENQDTMDVMLTSATMIWEADQYETAIGYIFRYKSVAETEWEELSTNEPLYLATGLEVCTEYEYQVRAVCPQDFSEYTESFVFSTTCFTSTEEIATGNDISALKVYPNPFKDRIHIDLQLEKFSDINLQLHNMNGQLIQSKDILQLPSGAHHLEIDQDNLSAGMYFLRIASENEVVLRKLVRN